MRNGPFGANYRGGSHPGIFLESCNGLVHSIGPKARRADMMKERVINLCQADFNVLPAVR